ncbi:MULTISPECIES: aminotransferase class I/II-fold pyridoxal phosphate-dependent enzyme [unclassified Pseudoalteromonas]|uniref:aminotransferase class I/II-fold pyridoxal phosphate-dependent enzyme n=1 Tax=unclassified Pseudoalteromonas TaxID=194690 RepID=UPI001023EAB5|nr:MULTISPECIES: 8-amino-7-oxononanoate synthase [unclassified Pseudoalteromonas]RZF87160.1 8-amino-7-oxononanoate synthase [Pseudoalteromonas sp. CO109Y]TMO35885.1 8-amino-7-oxononanoate synthase [Pseudoalteromonas sp. S4488]TMO38759.1 8-amino-7-oxononanoate synthase [Pseudoalteromonas sp. S4491]
MAFDFIAEHLVERQADALLRKRQLVEQSTGRFIQVAGKQYLNFASNDYLGFADDFIEIQAQHLGSHSSALVNGYNKPQQQLEQRLCELLGYESAMLFNSGFSANSSVLKALFQDKSVAQSSAIFQDKLNHASLIDGGLHSAAAMVRFNHNDLRHLESRLQKSKAKHKLIVSEGVFSMDGDQAPIEALCKLAKQYNAWLMIDDAHGFGVLGEQGLGSCEVIKPDLLIITFGKALASSGACLLASKKMIDYMLQFNREYIYSTAMSPLMASCTLERLEKLLKADKRRSQLSENIAYFRALAKEHNLALMESTTAIQPLVLGDAEHTLAVANKLKEKGVWLTAIRPPTVPFNTARLRVTISSAHQADDIKQLVDSLVECL